MYREKLTTIEKVDAPDAALDAEDDCLRHHDGWHCSRARGHDGPHVAHGARPAYAIWDNDRTTDTKE